MESPLEVLSRAATMVQDNSGDTRLTSKELPTTKWRRDRRIRVSSEYHSPPSPGNIKPLSESNSGNGESPLDMSVASSKPRTPPPPYREPLPGSTFATTLASRPSVITQAPKREIISNRENKDTVVAAESISMIDPVIDEHFRRSLGADYMNLFGNKKSTNQKLIIPKKNVCLTSLTTSPPPTPPSPSLAAAILTPAAPQLTPTALPAPKSIAVRPASKSPPPIVTTTSKSVAKPTETVPDSIGMSVDDHFAKALGGDRWKQLQADSKNENNSNSNISSSSSSNNSNNINNNSNNDATTSSNASSLIIRQCVKN